MSESKAKNKSVLISDSEAFTVTQMQAHKLAELESSLLKLAGMYVDDDGYTNSLIADAVCTFNEYKLLLKIMQNRDLEVCPF